MSRRLSISLSVVVFVVLGFISASHVHGQVAATPTPSLPNGQSGSTGATITPESESGVTGTQSSPETLDANGSPIVTTDSSGISPSPFTANPLLDNGQPTTSPVSGGLSCLPMQVGANDTVMENMQLTQKTVAQALRDRSAQCTQDGYQLPDGRRIQFYTLGGCYGLSSERLTQLARDADAQVQKLEQERNYDIIETACNKHELP